MNWYQSDGTYPGGVADFQEGWATVAAACRQIAPAVKVSCFALLFLKLFRKGLTLITRSSDVLDS